GAGRQPQRGTRAAGDLEGAFCCERLAAERADEFGKCRQILCGSGPTPAVCRIGAERERECCDRVGFTMRVDAAGPAVGVERMQDTSPRLQVVATAAPRCSQ